MQSTLNLVIGLVVGSFVALVGVGTQLHDTQQALSLAQADAVQCRANWTKYEKMAQEMDRENIDKFWRDNCQCKIIGHLEDRVAQLMGLRYYHSRFVALDRNDLYEEFRPYDLLPVWEMIGAPRSSEP